MDNKNNKTIYIISQELAEDYCGIGGVSFTPEAYYDEQRAIKRLEQLKVELPKYSGTFYLLTEMELVDDVKIITTRHDGEKDDDKTITIKHDDANITKTMVQLLSRTYMKNGTLILRSEIKQANYDILQMARYQLMHSLAKEYYEKFAKDNHLDIYSEIIHDDVSNMLTAEVFIFTKKQLDELLEIMYADVKGNKNDQVLRIGKIMTADKKDRRKHNG